MKINLNFRKTFWKLLKIKFSNIESISFLGEAETPSEAETVDTIDLKPVNKKEVALIELSRDFLALKSATELVENENARLKARVLKPRKLGIQFQTKIS